MLHEKLFRYFFGILVFMLSFIHTGPISIDCDRTCTMGDTRTCVFQWKVGYYYSMLTGLNRPCGNCPFNQSDCLRSGCVTLNGISRPVATVNREVPGPKIIVSVRVCVNQVSYLSSCKVVVSNADRMICG